MRRLWLLLLLVLVPVPGTSADWSTVVKKAEEALVYVESDDGSCTGFVIDTVRKYVLTAAHCKAEGLWADRVSAEVVVFDSKKDLMVLLVKELDPAKKALKMAGKNPAIGEEVMSVGYGYALERPFFRQTHVQDNALVLDAGVGGPFVSTDTPFVPGQSGGPVLNFSGDVVAIVQRGDRGTTGLGVGAEIIRDRVGRFFGK